MKLNFAYSFTGEDTFTPELYLYNCTRNAACTKPFYIPIPDYDDLMLFIALPGRPSSTPKFYMYHCEFGLIVLKACKYVVGKDSLGNWYMVIAEIITNSGDPLPTTGNFFLVIQIEQPGSVYYWYYSNEITLDVQCDNLTKVEACYNDPEIGADAFDCNGVYYGYPTNPIHAYGNLKLRYLHKAYVRQAEVLEQKNKMALTLFNNRTAYRNFVNKDYVFQFELVPGFWKDELAAIFNRGNIKINSVSYTLAEQQEFGITNESLKWWKMDIKLTELCKQWFSCTPTACELPANACGNCEGEYVIIEGVHLIQFDENCLDTINGERLGWEIYSSDGTLLFSGTTYTNFINLNDYIEEWGEGCWKIRWRKYCICGRDETVSEWSDYLFFGTCAECCRVQNIRACMDWASGPNYGVLRYRFDCCPSGANYEIKYRRAGTDDEYITEFCRCDEDRIIYLTNPYSPETYEIEGFIINNCEFGIPTEAPFNTGQNNFNFSSTLYGITTIFMSGPFSDLVTLPAINIFNQNNHHNGSAGGTIYGEYTGSPVFAGNITLVINGVIVDCYNIPAGVSGGNWSLDCPTVLCFDVVQLRYGTGSC